MQSTVSDTPLIDICQGRDQDDRAALLAAFYRVMGSHRRREVTDIHVRELLTYVLVNNRDGRGVQLSYDDVANTLCCERSTARKVVERACVIFGLLAVTEDRYVRGGQAPNRYSIDWPAVRSINAGCLPRQPLTPSLSPDYRGEGASVSLADGVSRGCIERTGDRSSAVDSDRGAVLESLASRSSQLATLSPTAVAVPQSLPGSVPAATRYHPGATMYHPPATTGQGAATTGHPYKEDTLLSSLTLKRAAARAAAEKFKFLDWEEIKRQANKLLKAKSELGREYVWQVVVVAESLERGYSGDLITKLLSGDVRKPRSYLDAALRGECGRHGLDWPSMREVVPPPGPTRGDEP